MQIPRDLEQELTDQLPTNGETIVAFALLHEASSAGDCRAMP